MRIGVLTAGGDAPGLNAAIRSLGRCALAEGHEFIGVRNGWAGLAGVLDEVALGRDSLSGILARGGTILGSSRFDLDVPAGGRERVLSAASNFDALVAIGGDGTMKIAQWLAEHGCPIVGVPKTLDNDLAATEYCIGFDTAVGTVTDALDRLHTTAASHHRVIVLETMGHHSGWIATMGGLAGGADYVVIPEIPTSIDNIAAHVTRRHRRGAAFSIVVVAEGVSPENLLDHDASSVRAVTSAADAGIGHFLADQIRARTGYETRCSVLGYLQRGGSPSSFDRIWASHVGAAAYGAVTERDWGSIPVVRGSRVVRARLSDVIAEEHRVPRELFDLCAKFF